MERNLLLQCAFEEVFTSNDFQELSSSKFIQAKFHVFKKKKILFDGICSKIRYHFRTEFPATSNC